jgi:hypothetical protein
MGGSLINHICSELKILAIEIKHLGLDYDLDCENQDEKHWQNLQEKVWQDLREIIIKHQNLIEYVLS